jgi:hypothetical protein
MVGPNGFEENAQAPLGSDDDADNVIDESLWGPQKKLTPQEQADYDAWFMRQVQKSVDYSKRPDAVYIDHEDVMAMMWEILEDRIAKASKSSDQVEP